MLLNSVSPRGASRLFVMRHKTDAGLRRYERPNRLVGPRAERVTGSRSHLYRRKLASSGASKYRAWLAADEPTAALDQISANGGEEWLWAT
jgi:hypothetical protein